MNEFEKRYFPCRGKFKSRCRKFHRCHSLTAGYLREHKQLLTQVFLSFPTKNSDVRGKKIIFLSDWHWHGSPRNFRLLDEFTAAAAKIKPDILILGGDMCDDAQYLNTLDGLLEKLSHTADEVIAVKGNWEVGKRWLDEKFFDDLFAKYNIRMLNNGFFSVSGITFYTLPDISSIDFRIPEKSSFPECKADILLTHSPDGIIAADKHGFLNNFSLALCGHNHGGQIRLPLIGSLYCPSIYRRRFDKGIFCRDDMDLKMVVSSGIGEHKHSFRFYCPPEIIVLEII